MIKETSKIQQFKQHFKGSLSFSITEIVEFYRKTEFKITVNTVKARIRRMVLRDQLYRVSRGRYSLIGKPFYKPIFGSNEKSIYSNLKKEFPFLKICIWNTNYLSAFMLHQPAVNYIIIEVESDADIRTMHSQSIFNFLKSIYKNVYHQPSVELINNYILDHNQSIIVIPMISEAPIQMLKGINTVSLEKMLVDIFSNEILFIAQQGNEMDFIFREAFGKYTIYASKFERYLTRRGKKKKMSQYLNSLKLNYYD